MNGRSKRQNSNQKDCIQSRGPKVVKMYLVLMVKTLEVAVGARGTFAVQHLGSVPLVAGPYYGDQILEKHCSTA